MLKEKLSDVTDTPDFFYAGLNIYCPCSERSENPSPREQRRVAPRVGWKKADASVVQINDSHCPQPFVIARCVKRAVAIQLDSAALRAS